MTDLQTLVTYYFTPLIKTKCTLPAFLPVRNKLLMELGEMVNTVTSRMALLLYVFPHQCMFYKTLKFPQFWFFYECHHAMLLICELYILLAVQTLLWKTHHSCCIHE